MILNYGPRLKEFAYRPPEHDRRLNILHGSVRSGKTWSLIPKIIYGCRYSVSGWRVFTGVNKESVYRNVLYDLFNIVGGRHYQYNHQSGFLRLFDSSWYVIGANDEGSEKNIRGMTIGYGIADELVLMPRGFLEMFWNRMSPPGARFYGSTNTDSPLHWLKTDYLDNPKLYDQGILYSLHTTMDDNPNLTEDYKRTQRTMYKGLFFKRFIEALWVMAEGSIYKDVWSDRNVFDDADIPITLFNAGGTKARTIVLDYGTTNPNVFLDYRDDGKTVWVCDELRWDSKKEMRQKTDADYVNDLDVWLKRDRSPRIVVDPSAASMKIALSRKGFWVTDANNDVDEGLRKTSLCLASGMLRFHRTKCARTIQEFEVYAWDPKKAARGLEEPIKQNDHGPDNVRYFCNTIIPHWRLN